MVNAVKTVLIKIISIILCLIGCLFSISSVSYLFGIIIMYRDNPYSNLFPYIGALLALASLAFIFIYFSIKLNRYNSEQSQQQEQQYAAQEEYEKLNEGIYLTTEAIQRFEEDDVLPSLTFCELLLQPTETAVYGCIARGLTAIEQTSVVGSFYITTCRIAFISDEYNLILTYEDLTAVTPFDEGLIFHCTNRSHKLFMTRSELAYHVFLAAQRVHMNPTLHSTLEVGCDDVSVIDNMEGHDFEYFCAELLRKNGFCDVEVTKGSGDQGVDILAVKGGIKYAIQCKNYNSKLGNTPVQEVNAGKTFYNCHVGVVMTNSTFTPSAIELANSTNVLLWDRASLQGFMDNTK